MSKFSGQYHHGNLAVALEDAAIQLLAERSLSQLSLREIARHAGVSHNAPYHHFGDKQGLLKAIAARSLKDLLAAMTAGSNIGTSARDRLLGAGMAYVSFAVDRPAQFAAIFDPEICDPTDPDPVTAPLVAANDEFLRTIVIEALPETDSAKQLTTANAMWGTLHGIAVLVSAKHLDREQVMPMLEVILELIPHHDDKPKKPESEQRS